MALTDSAIRALKPRDAVYKEADEKGLYLMVTPAGARSPTRTSFALPITAVPIGGGAGGHGALGGGVSRCPPYWGGCASSQGGQLNAGVPVPP
jgi:hypothetical protein